MYHSNMASWTLIFNNVNIDEIEGLYHLAVLEAIMAPSSVLEFRIFELSPGGVPELGPKKH